MRFWVISDLQCPFHDVRAVDAVTQAITDLKVPGDQVICVGDEMDFQTISRWSQGTELEWERSIGKDRDTTIRVLRDLQVSTIMRSNHTDRLFFQIRKRIPGLLGLPELELPAFMGNHFEYKREPWNFTGNWLLMHGDESGVRGVAGATARGLSDKTGMSVACGHTHRLGLVPSTESFNGKARKIRWGLEVGNLMDPKKASYTGGIANWQAGFAVIDVHGNTAIPTPIPIVNRSFVIDGERYSW
jgi:hypothetical protein